MAGVELGHQRYTHINFLDKSKSSPLHLAVRGGNIEAICFCIANGAKIDQQQVEYTIYEGVRQNLKSGGFGQGYAFKHEWFLLPYIDIKTMKMYNGMAARRAEWFWRMTGSLRVTAAAEQGRR